MSRPPLQDITNDLKMLLFEKAHLEKLVSKYRLDLIKQDIALEKIRAHVDEEEFWSRDYIADIVHEALRKPT